MTADDRTSDRQRDLNFFGEITASVSHDLSNIVCVLHQISGLLEDMIIQGQQGVPFNRERIITIKDRLVRQSERAKELTAQLNRFAHGVDCRWLEFEVNAVIRNLVAVSNRFADLKGVKLETVYCPENVCFVGDPLSLQQVVFGCLRRAYSLASEKTTVEISVRVDALGKSVVVTRSNPVGDKAELGLEAISDVAMVVPARIDLRNQGGRERLFIRLLESDRPDRPVTSNP